VGAGDFCSREHRNQYRMRQGMDRLLEANQVANVIRRREVPKPITSHHPPAEIAPRPADGSFAHFIARRSALAIPESRWSPPVRIPGARGPVKHRVRSPLPARRDFGMLSGLVKPVEPEFRSLKVDPPGAVYMNKIRLPRVLPLRPVVGSALRVSAANGFRLPPIQKDAIEVPPPPNPKLLFPGRPLTPPPDLLNRRVGRKDLAIFIEPHFKEKLRATQPVNGHGLVPPGVKKFVMHVHNRDGAAASRSWGALWTFPDEVIVRPLKCAGYERSVPGMIALYGRRFTGGDDPRVALAPITPQEGAIRYAPVFSRGVQHAPAAPQAKLEEHFEQGFANWVGGMADWQVDAAGVRPGSLALYKPSLAFADYDLEFLTRIDNRSLTWIFRACGFDDYYAATIIGAGDGIYELTHHIVIKGTAEPPAPADAVTFSPGPRTAFPVRMRAQGDEFTVWADGQQIATWRDSRLSSGGIGFAGAHENRARIYWVKVSPAGDFGKEQRTS